MNRLAFVTLDRLIDGDAAFTRWLRHERLAPAAGGCDEPVLISRAEAVLLAESLRERGFVERVLPALRQQGGPCALQGEAGCLIHLARPAACRYRAPAGIVAFLADLAAGEDEERGPLAAMVLRELEAEETAARLAAGGAR